MPRVYNRRPMPQLSLFGADPAESRPTASSDADATFARAVEEDAATAALLPPGLRFGTSSWAFPGWAGIVYAPASDARALARHGLAEYSRHPLMRTVGIDRTYYAPLTVDEWARYAGQLPSGFPCCAKAPASVMDPMVRTGRGTPWLPNPDFLSVDRLVEELLEPCAAAFAGHAGPFILESPPTPGGFPVEPSEFAARLDAMLERLAGTFRFAVEIRDRRLLTPEYARVLRRHGASHVYNYWSAMPLPGAQVATVPLDTAAFVVLRLLMRPGTRYEDQRELFRPFDRIVQPDERLREEVDLLSRGALRKGREVFVLVNNKAEGSAPLTIRALARRIADALGTA